MVMQFGVNEEFEDAPDVMMCECLGEEEDDGGGVRAAPGKNYTNLPKLGDPPVISCHLLLRLLDDALNMMRSLQYVTIGLVTRLDDMKYKFSFEDLFEKLRWHANCYWEWQEADSSKFLESQQAVVDSARTLCYFFLEFSRLHTEGAGIFRTKVPPSGREFFLGGNWKCNGTSESVRNLVADLNAAEFADVEDVDVVVFPPSIYIDQVVSSLTERIHVGAQNCWTGKGGAFMGETSAKQLADMGMKWVVVGHAKRRHVVGESNAMVARKVTYALLQGLDVIIAIGNACRA